MSEQVTDEIRTIIFSVYEGKFVNFHDWRSAILSSHLPRFHWLAWKLMSLSLMLMALWWWKWANSSPHSVLFPLRMEKVEWKFHENCFVWKTLSILFSTPSSSLCVIKKYDCSGWRVEFFSCRNFNISTEEFHSNSKFLARFRVFLTYNFRIFHFIIVKL